MVESHYFSVFPPLSYGEKYLFTYCFLFYYFYYFIIIIIFLFRDLVFQNYFDEEIHCNLFLHFS